MCICLLVNCPLFFSDYNKSWILWQSLKKNFQISHFIKIRPLGAELLHADRQDMTKLRVAFRKYANAPKTRLTCRRCTNMWRSQRNNSHYARCFAPASGRGLWTDYASTHLNSPLCASNSESNPPLQAPRVRGAKHCSVKQMYNGLRRSSDFPSLRDVRHFRGV